MNADEPRRQKMARIHSKPPFRTTRAPVAKIYENYYKRGGTIVYEELREFVRTSLRKMEAGSYNCLPTTELANL
jgi:hypothetical protein